MCAVLAISLAAPSHAGLSVAPTTITLAPGTQNSSLRVRNTGEIPVSIQVSLVAWTQDGRDRYKPSKNLAYFPKLLSLEAGASRTIRIGRLPETPDGQIAPNGSEKAYRLAVRELPDMSRRDAPVQFSTRIRVPVFVQNGAPHQEWHIDSLEIGETPVVTVKNMGNRHIRVKDIIVSGIGSDGRSVAETTLNGWRILSGGTFKFIGQKKNATLCDASVEHILVQVESQDHGQQERRFPRAVTCEN